MKKYFSYLVGFFLFCLCVSLFCCNSKTQLSNKEKQYLTNNPNITVGIYISFPPYLFVNNNGEIDGILLDYFNKLESNINHTFKKKYYNNWQTLIEDGENKKIDIILEIQSTEKRKQFFSFTDPVFIGRHIILTKNNTNILTIDDLNGKIVSIGNDYAIEEFLRTNYPDIILSPRLNEKTSIEALIKDDVEAFIGLETMTKYLISQEGYKNLKIQGAIDYNNELAFAIDKEQPILTNIIKKGNGSISAKEKNEIFSEWLYDIAMPFNQKAPFWRKLFATIAVLFIILFLLSLYLKNEVQRQTKELIKAKQVAEQSNRLKTLFIQNISHEVRTPLNSIIGFTSFLNEEKSETTKREYINTILKESSNLTNIINNVIEISELTTKKDKPKIQTVDLYKELELLENTYKTIAKRKGLTFLFNSNIEANDNILCNKTRLSRSINNILDNAVKFTKKGSVILNASIENNTLKITVEDTGIGIDASKLKSIFSEFYQEETELSKKYDGLGIGLSIAKENIRSLGGIISLETKKGEGSIFTIELPIQFSTEDYKAEVKEINHKLRILIAEDMKLNYLVLQKTLDKVIQSDMEIVWAKNGQEAVDLVERSDFDVIFMDIKMPILNGYEATKVIKKIEPEIIVIAQTSYAQEENVDKANAIGFDAYMTKPINLNSLKTILRGFFTKKIISDYYV